MGFLHSKNCLEYELTQEIKELLENKYNTIHAPTRDIIYSKKGNCEKVIHKLKKIYDYFKCKNINFHVYEQIDCEFLLNEFKDYVISFENPSLKNNKEYFQKILEKKYSITLDFCHVMRDSAKELKKLSKYNNINEIHWSYFYTFNHNSGSLCFNNDVELMLKNVKYIDNKKNGNLPIVIELDLRQIKGKGDILKQEIQMLEII